MPAHLPARTVASAEVQHNFFAPVFYGVADQATFLRQCDELRKSVAPGHYFGDNLITWNRNNSFLDDAAFRQAWESNIESDADASIAWRRYILCCAAYHCVQLDGDFVECGAYKGVGVKTVIDYLGGKEFAKQFWAYDTFEHLEGMPNQRMAAHGPDLFDRVRAKFEEYDQVQLVRGLIPASLKDSPRRIAYLHIDLNQPQAEIDALEVLFDRVVPGGFVILDDYEWSGVFRSQKLAEDAWFDARRYRVMPLPTGQGLVFKR